MIKWSRFCAGSLYTHGFTNISINTLINSTRKQKSKMPLVIKHPTRDEVRVFRTKGKSEWDFFNNKNSNKALIIIKILSLWKFSSLPKKNCLRNLICKLEAVVNVVSFQNDRSLIYPSQKQLFFMIRVKSLACATLRTLQKLQKETYWLNTRTNFELFSRVCSISERLVHEMKCYFLWLSLLTWRESRPRCKLPVHNRGENLLIIKKKTVMEFEMRSRAFIPSVK